MIYEKMIDSRAFRDVMGTFATGVTIVTVINDGIPHGMTVNSFTSVSLDPALILVCLDKDATTTEILKQTGRFSVNILTDKQEHLAQRFAEEGAEGSRFEGVEFSMSDEGIPILHGVAGNMTCIVKDTIEGGDHLIFVGEVVDLYQTKIEHWPLLFYRGKFKSLAVE